MPYDAFISYSHAVDGKLAPAIQGSLQAFGKPFYRLRARRVFRDETSLHLTLELWPTIQKALAESRHFILMASPGAAASPWVEKEIIEWLLHDPGLKRFHIVLTEGDVHWDAAAGEIDWARTNAVPRILAGRFRNEPGYLDFRFARTPASLKRSDPRYVQRIGKMASAIDGVDPDTLIGDDVRQHRILRTVSGITIVVLALLLAAGSGAAWFAEQRRIKLQHASSDRDFRAGSEQLLAGDFAGGVAYLERALSINPENAPAADRLFSLLVARTQPRLSRRIQGTADAVRLSLNADGSSMAIIGEKHAVWVTPDGRRRNLNLGQDDPKTARFLPDGRLLLIGTGPRLFVFPPDEKRPPDVHELPAPPTRYALSSDGKWLAMAPKKGGPVSLVSLAGAGPAQRVPRASEVTALALAFLDHDGKLAVSSGSGYQTVALDGSANPFPAADVAIPSKDEDDDEDMRVAIASTGASCETYYDGGTDVTMPYLTIAVKEPGAQQPSASHTYDITRAIDVEAASSGRFFDVTLDTDEVLVFDAKGREVVLRHQGVRLARASPTRDVVLTASDDGSVRLWNAATGAEICAPLQHAKSVIDAEFSGDGNTVAVLTADGMIHFWSASPGIPVPVQSRAAAREAGLISDPECVSADGRRAVYRVSGDWKSKTTVWQVRDVAGKRVLATYSHPEPADRHSLEDYYGVGGVPIAVISNDGDLVITADCDTPVRVWRGSSARPVLELKTGSRSFVSYIHLAPAGDRVMIGYDSPGRYRRPLSSYEIFSLTDGKSLTDGPIALREGQTILAIAPDLSRVIIGDTVLGNTMSASVQDAYDSHRIGQTARHQGPVWMAGFSGDQSMFYTASRDGTIRIWDTETGFPLSEPLVFDRHPHAYGGERVYDDYFATAQRPEFLDGGKRIRFDGLMPGDAAKTWDISPGSDPATVALLTELSAAVFGVRLSKNGALQYSPQRPAAEIAAAFGPRTAAGTEMWRVVRSLRR